MVTLTNAENALKTVYLGVVSNQLNTNINPLLGKIKQSTADVWGKEVRKLAPYGLNGGIGAGTEDGDLPSAAANNYVQFVSSLKNLYGTIEISDKAIRASANNAGAFVNLLNAEMEGLVKASSFNFGRMLYGNGSGIIATISDSDDTTQTLTVDSVRNIMEGMVIDIYAGSSAVAGLTGARITTIDRKLSTVKIDKTFTLAEVTGTLTMSVQNSRGLELTGLGAIFDEDVTTLYGVDRTVQAWMNPYSVDMTSATELSDISIQTAIDYLDEVAGSTVDFIVCSAGVKRAYQEYLNTYKRNVDIMNLEGGYKALSYSGIPLVSDRFVPSGTLYLLNTKEFTLHQLCDWKWLEGEDGRVIKQNAGKATYTATLVKYADLICDKPSGQAMLYDITEV
ncbi:MAG: phage major capsid protein [Clostridia bacterium]|jgi:hypothetical protein|nr:phage major capsid protein [Clostridia bacterium]